MAASKLPLDRMVTVGKPYRIDNGDFEGAFAYRIGGDRPGAHPDPRHPGGFVIAFSPVCTHMGCLLVRSEQDHGIQGDATDHLTCGPCPCHGTTFDLLRAGLVVLGPATQNLGQLGLQSDGGDVLAVEWLQNEKQHIDPVEEVWPF